MGRTRKRGVVIGAAAKLLFAFTGNAICERVRPTVIYTGSAQVRFDGELWYQQTWEAGRRRPWQRMVSPAFPGGVVLNSEGLTLPFDGPTITLKEGQEFTVSQVLVAPDREAAKISGRCRVNELPSEAAKGVEIFEMIPLYEIGGHE